MTGWDAEAGIYYIDDVATTLDENGDGCWAAGSEYPYAGGAPQPVIDGWNACNSTYYLGGITTPLSQSGTGFWEGDGVSFSPTYWIGGTGTTLNANGNGTWEGQLYYQGQPVTLPPVRTLYFNGAVSQSWFTLENWWNDEDCTDPAVALPGEDDNVVVFSDIDGGPDYPFVPVANAEFYGTANAIMNMTVSGTTTLNEYSSLDGGNLNTTSGTTVFNDYSSLIGLQTIGGDTAVFNDHSSNRGYLATEEAVFNHNAEHYGHVWTGAVTFNDSAVSAGGSFSDPWGGVCAATFNDSSFFLTSQGQEWLTGWLGNFTLASGVRTPYPIPRGINGSSILGVM